MTKHSTHQPPASPHEPHAAAPATTLPLTTNSSHEAGASSGSYEKMPYPPTRVKRRIPLMFWVFMVGVILTIAGIICFTVAVERAGSLYNLALHSGYQEPTPVTESFDTADLNQITVVCPDGYRISTKLANSPDNQVHITYTPEATTYERSVLQDVHLDCNREKDRVTVSVNNKNTAVSNGVNYVFDNDRSINWLHTAVIPELYFITRDINNYEDFDDHPNLVVEVPASFQGTLRFVPAQSHASLTMSAHLITDYQGSAQLDIGNVVLVEGKQLITSGDISINRSMLFIGVMQGNNVKLQDTLSGLGLAHLPSGLLNDSFEELIYPNSISPQTQAVIQAENLEITSAWPVVYDRVDAKHINATSNWGFVSLGLKGTSEDYTVETSTGYTKEAAVTLPADDETILNELTEEIAQEMKGELFIKVTRGESKDSHETKSSTKRSDQSEHNNQTEPNSSNNGPVTSSTMGDANSKTLNVRSFSSFMELSHFGRRDLLDAIRDNKPNVINTTWEAGSYSGTMFAAYHAPLPTKEIQQTSGNGERTLTIHAPHGHADLQFGK